MILIKLIAVGLIIGGITVATSFLIAILQKIFPSLRPHVINEKLTFEELKTHYQRWEIVSIPVLILFAILFGVFWYQIFLQGARLTYLYWHRTDESVFFLVPHDLYYGVVAIFMGISSAGMAGHWFYSGLLREKYGEYLQYIDHKRGVNNVQTLRIFCGVTSVLTLGAACSGIFSYVDVSSEVMRFRHLWTIRLVEYTYSEVSAISMDTHFRTDTGAVKKKPRPHYVIYFSDGTQWTPARDFCEPEISVLHNMMRFIATQSGQRIREGMFIEDVVPVSQEEELE